MGDNVKSRRILRKPLGESNQRFYVMLLCSTSKSLIVLVVCGRDTEKVDGVRVLEDGM